jgi:hypothetical protein
MLEKFKTVEEQARGYAEVEKKMQQQAEAQSRMEAQISQLADLVEQQTTVQQQAPQQSWGQPDQNTLREQLMASFETDPIGTMAWMAQQASQQYVDTRLQTLQQENTPVAHQQIEQQNQLMAMAVDRALGDQYNDWNQYKERVAEEIEKDPSLLPQEMLSTPEATMRQLTRIYENVKARDVLEQAQTGNFVQSELSNMKRQAQTISGSGQRPGEPSSEEEKVARIIAAAKGMSYSAWRDGA